MMARILDSATDALKTSTARAEEALKAMDEIDETAAPAARSAAEACENLRAARESNLAGNRVNLGSSPGRGPFEPQRLAAKYRPRVSAAHLWLMAAATGMTSPISASRDSRGITMEDPSPGTRHHTLLSSNDSPSDSDIAFIRSVLAESDRRLQSVHEEIQNLTLQPQAESAFSSGILQRLEEERTCLLAFRARNIAILSPLRRMPPELLREIFFLTLPSLDTVLDAKKFDLGVSPWLLTHVCGLWRVVSLSMPSLWSQIAIEYHYSEGFESPPIYSLHVAETQLRRAGLLKVHFYSSETTDAGPQLEMFNLLASQCSRWEELSIRLTSIIAPSFLLPLRDRLSSLRRVSLEISHPPSTSTTELQCLDCFDSAPSLIEFECFHGNSFLPITLPVGQLVRYESNAPWERHLQILNQASNLVEARIQLDFQGGADWPDLPIQAVNLIHLQRLHVSHASALRYLRAPNLEQLAMVDIPHSTESLNSYFRSFISSSSCQIRRLILDSPSAETLIEILEHAYITELVIMEDEDSDTHAVFETLEASGYIIAPQLTLIFLACSNIFSIHYTPFLKMLQSRWRAENCPLQHAALLIDGGGKPSSSTLDGLMKLRQDGLDLKMIVDDDTAALLAMREWDFQTTWN